VSTSRKVQAWKIARRSIARTLRQPIVIVPNVVFPLILFGIQAGGAEDAADIEGFPTDSYLTFAFAATFVQGAIGSATVAGNGLGSDIESGFISRLSLTPISSGALLAGQLAGAAVLGVLQAVLYVGVGVASGADFESGAGGAVALVPLTLLMCLAFGAIGLMAAAATGSAERVQAVFPMMLALLFMSSLAMPRNLIEENWFKTIATINPMSYLIEAPRSLLISGWDGEALALGCGIALVITLLGIQGSRFQMRTRMERT
jgi:ABC-2 type transport system permease protein